jgi:hypothetical protein
MASIAKRVANFINHFDFFGRRVGAFEVFWVGYAEALSQLLSGILTDEITGNDLRGQIIDRVSEALASVPLPANSATDRKLLLGRAQER